MEQAMAWYGMTALLFFAVLLVLHLLKKAVQPYAFPIFLDWFSGQYNTAMESFKVELLQTLGSLREVASSNEDGKEPDPPPLTILEIGVGTGANFKYYPEGSLVVAVEPNANFAGYLARNVALHSPRVRLERTVVAPAEDLRGHVDDCSMDAVVSTLVLCSVEDVDAVVREAKRVLKPGGKFYYLEHVVADPGSWTKLSQWLVHPLWCYIFDGCRLMRAPWVSVERAGFTEANCKKFMAPPLSFGPMRPHAMGVATK